MTEDIMLEGMNRDMEEEWNKVREREVRLEAVKIALESCKVNIHGGLVLYPHSVIADADRYFKYIWDGEEKSKND